MGVNSPLLPNSLLLRQPAISVVRQRGVLVFDDGGLFRDLSNESLYLYILLSVGLEDHTWFLRLLSRSSSAAAHKGCWYRLKCPSVSWLNTSRCNAGGSPPSNNHLYVSFHTIFIFHFICAPAAPAAGPEEELTLPADSFYN